VLANGGNSSFSGDHPVGAGGAVRVIAAAMRGTGEIRAMGGSSGLASDHGRIRLETLAPEHDFKLSPETLAVRPSDPPILWPAANAPTVRVLMVDGVESPADPTAPLARTADIALQNERPVDVVLETRNFPLEGVVEVRGTGKFGGGLGGGSGWHRAAHVSGDFERALWRVSQPLPKGFTVLQARAVLP
jgi:hypothetical protein